MYMLAHTRNLQGTLNLYALFNMFVNVQINAVVASLWCNIVFITSVIIKTAAPINISLRTGLFKCAAHLVKAHTLAT